MTSLFSPPSRKLYVVCGDILLAVGLSTMEAPVQAVIPNSMLALLEQKRTVVQRYLSTQNVAKILISFKSIELEGKYYTEDCNTFGKLLSEIREAKVTLT